jgi:hypothetical protein
MYRGLGWTISYPKENVNYNHAMLHYSRIDHIIFVWIFFIIPMRSGR